MMAVAASGSGRSGSPRDQGDIVRTQGYRSQSLALYRDLGKAWGQGYALNNLALAATMVGDLTQAEARANEALALFRTHGLQGGEVEVLLTLGHMYAAQGLYEPALGEGAFVAAWAAGEALSMDEAVTYALDGPPRADSPAGGTARSAPSSLAGAAATRPLPERRRGATDALVGPPHRTRKERQAWALEYPRTASALSPRAYAQAMAVSVDTALIDLRDLMARSRASGGHHQRPTI